MVHKYFDEKPGSGKKANVLAEELHKPVAKKFNRKNVNTRFKNNIWAVDLVEMGSLSFKNRGAIYLLCVIMILDVFTQLCLC